jgi:DNA-binding GntR family transcriptional regulator
MARRMRSGTLVGPGICRKVAAGLQAEMEAAHTGRDLPAYYRINRQIHDRLNVLADNAVLEQTYRTLNTRLHALRFRSNLNPAKWDQAVAEHRAMIEALAARDGAALRELLVGHLRAKQQAVLDSMENRDDKNLQGGIVP